MCYLINFILLLGYIQIAFGFAPGTLTVKFQTISIKLKDINYPPKMDYKIFDSTRKIFTSDNGVEMMKELPRTLYRKTVFNLDNVGQKFGANVTLHINKKKYEYEMNFQSNKNKYKPNQDHFEFGPFYNLDYTIQFFVYMMIRCKTHYYPNNNCTKKCTEFNLNEICDSMGNKKCKAKYILDSASNSCMNNWCIISNEKCKNNAPCTNTKNGIICVCPLHFSGKLCEQYNDPCLTYQCQDGSSCSVVGDNVRCIPPKAISSMKVSSSTIMMVLVAVCLLLLVVCVVACMIILAKHQNRKRSISHQNCHLNRQIPSLHDNSSLEHYKNHIMFNQIPSEQSSLKNWQMTPPMSHNQGSIPQSNEYIISCPPNQNGMETVNLLQARFNEQMSDRMKTYVLPTVMPPESVNQHHRLIRSQSAQNISINQDALSNRPTNTNNDNCHQYSVNNIQNKPNTSCDSLRYKTPNYTASFSRNMRTVIPNVPTVRFNDEIPSVPQVSPNNDNPSITSNQDLPDPPSASFLRRNSGKLFSSNQMNGSMFI